MGAVSAADEGLDALIDVVTIDAAGDDEQLIAFLTALEEVLPVPQAATIVDIPIEVVGVEHGGDVRRGLVAVCLRDGAEHRVSLADVRFNPRSEAARLVAAYRRWTGCEPWPHRELDPGAKRSAAWRYPGHVKGAEAAAARATAIAIKQPLGLEPWPPWDPADAWPPGPDEPVPACIEPILAAGPRPAFEFEQIIPGEEPETMYDPIIESADRARSGDREGARRRLRSLIAEDPRCLDAHSHVGWLAFEFSAKRALPNYQTGVAIAERSLPPGFSGVLPWGLIDNRPFLRCLHGLGLCHWRLARYDEATTIFESLLWLNPTDNQGARDLLELTRKRLPWLPTDL